MQNRNSENRVSVVIPTFNRLEYLIDALRSVFFQTHPVFEVLIINNGAPENAEKAIEVFPECCSQVKLFSLHENKGPGYARNLGIDQSQGDWILFLDDDDLLAPDFIETSLNSFFEQEPVDFILGRALPFESASPIRVVGIPHGIINLKRFKKSPLRTFLYNGFATHCCVTRKTAIGKLRFREELWAGEDTLFWYEFLKKKPRIAVNENGWSAVRIHSGKLSLKQSALEVGEFSSHSIHEIWLEIRKSLSKEPEWLHFLIRNSIRFMHHRIKEKRTLYSLLAPLLEDPGFGARFYAYRLERFIWHIGSFAFNLRTKFPGEE
ncbi:MAG: glycosyltransferase family 2 protein [Candidatus Riflebacteria bacterium]|nr:glycosyltransferase family 2 protein [Candidatus Riflebacteria bacterium]